MTKELTVEELEQLLTAKREQQAQELAESATDFINLFMQFANVYTAKKSQRTYAQLDFNKLKGAKVEGVKIGSSGSGAYIEIV